MYGQIHEALKDFLQKTFGMETWYHVIMVSGLDETEDFDMFKFYDDSMTMNLINSVSNVLDLPVDTVLKLLGTHFLPYCMNHGHDKLLTTLGNNFTSFISNLDSLHSMLTFQYPGILAPSFRAVDHQDGSITLHYYSQRKGLHPIVEGIIESAARELFQQTAAMTMISREDELFPGGKSVTHVCWKIETKQVDPNIRPRVRWAMRGVTDQTRVFDPQVALGQHAKDPGKNTVIKKEDMALVMPFHILLDKDLVIQQCGKNIKALSTVSIQDGKTPFKKVGVVVQPQIEMTAENILSYMNSIFSIAIHRKVGEAPFVLKGQMAWLPYCGKIMFMGSPRITSLEHLQEMNTYISDIPLYDVTRELVLLKENRVADIDIAKKLDEMTFEMKRMSHELEEEKNKIEDLLHEILPRKVAAILIQGKLPEAEKFDAVTILFCDIVNFTNIAAASNPMDVVHMLNEIYSGFDNHTDPHDVYKVETIGDAYMAVAGIPERGNDHAERIADFAMDMLIEADKIKSPVTGLPLQIRVGMHSGAVVAGVVGKKMPRYCLFGDTVNTSSRMESHGMPGRIHVSPVTFKHLWPFGYTFIERGELELKGKGLMKTYFLTGCFERRVVLPADEFQDLPDIVNDNPTRRTHEGRERYVPKSQGLISTHNCLMFARKVFMKRQKSKEVTEMKSGNLQTNVDSGVREQPTDKGKCHQQ